METEHHFKQKCVEFLWGAITLVGLSFILMGCNKMRSPGSSYRSAVSVFDHSTATERCTSCHLSDSHFTVLKSSTVKTLDTVTGVVSATASTPSHQLVHEGIDFTAVDCDSCHSVKENWDKSWKLSTLKPLGEANHSFFPASSTCSSCHLSPPTAALVAKVPTVPAADTSAARNFSVGALFTHAGNTGISDCNSCHFGVPGSPHGWKGGNFPHASAPTTCLGCHSPYVGHSAGAAPGECKTCHINAIPGVTFGPGVGGHASGTESCNSCHDSGGSNPSMPVATLAVGHLPAGNASAGHVFFHDRSQYISTLDCYSCHGNRKMGFTWATGKYGVNHGSMAVASKTACLNCHTKPIKTGTKSHDTIGALDCSRCHDVPSVGKLTWIKTYNHSKGESSGVSGGKSNHVCQFCH